MLDKHRMITTNCVHSHSIWNEQQGEASWTDLHLRSPQEQHQRLSGDAEALDLVLCLPHRPSWQAQPSSAYLKPPCQTPPRLKALPNPQGDITRIALQ